MLRITINAEALNNPRTGVGQYTLGLYEGLRSHVDITSVEMLNLHSTTPPKIYIPIISGALYRFRRFQEFSLANSDVYHEPNFQLAAKRIPSVATFHDLSCIAVPQYHPVERVRSFERWLPKTLRRAGHIVAVSKASRDALIEVGADPQVVTTVEPGIDQAFHPLASGMSTYALAKFGIDRPFVLALGTLEPRKNWNRLVEAFLSLEAAQRDRVMLVFAGPRGWHLDQLRPEITANDAGNAIRWIGYVDQQDLPALINCARGVVYPSLFEGFGLPVLESLACGRPVVASSATPSSDYVGAAGVVVAAEDVDAMRAGLVRLFDDDALQAAAAQQSEAVRQRFTWQSHADACIEIYKTLI